MENSIWADPATKPKLDPNIYQLHGDLLLFFKEQTGIQDEDELKQHVLGVQAKAYEIFGYPCIRLLTFLQLGISELPGYKHVLSLLEKYPDPILLDIGCCFGVDVRKVVVDGWPVDKIIGSDIQQGFWDFGHLLFKSTPESFPAGFIVGDAFDSALIDPESKGLDENAPLPPLNQLKSLSPLLHKISAIHVSSVFHLFSEERQRELAGRLLSLLAIRPGSIILGMHCGLQEAGIWEGLEESNFRMFCHSPNSWKKLWKDLFKEAGYDEQKVEVDAALLDVKTANPVGSTDEALPVNWTMLVWSVKII
ncbi:hypothetical protein CPB84DRAFT_1749022 [Gymnopilus junonius]|uniref:Methyltransferase domain-containing protein n=1 Tax=Gymnopilus junonius TaxID=109634 RepID=A0A9P5NJN0_GYMJU|nr:hypothetical protein CPB84DRAFT_1749022 [Gymnopilus junonius]